MYKAFSGLDATPVSWLTLVMTLVAGILFLLIGLPLAILPFKRKGGKRRKAD